jgi:two-component system, LuxR family, sensor kinase FixL
MSWIVILWSMDATVCLTLAAIYLLIWSKQRDEPVYLLFFCCAVGVAGIAGFELALIRAQTAAQYGSLLRWAQVPVWVVTVSLVWFVRRYLQAGRLWMVWTICGLRTVALALGFLLTPNLNYRAITGLRPLSWWGGESVSIAIGASNPWTLVGQISVLLLLAFCIDATITASRRGERQRALIVGGSAIFFVLAALAQSVLVFWGKIDMPFFISFPFLGIIAAMAYELSSDLLRAAQVTRRLQVREAELRESTQRMDLAASAAGFGVWMWDVARNDISMTEQGRLLFGFAPSEKLNIERFRSMIHPDDRATVLATVEKSLRTGAEYESEYRIVLPDGITRWVAGRGRVENGSDGKPARIRGVSIDITQRKLAEEEFRVAVEASPIGIIIVNDEGRIVLINPETGKLFGYAREELINQPVEVLVPERLRGGHLDHRTGFLSAPEARVMGAGRELFARRKDGTEFPVEVGLSPMETGTGLLVLALIMDISVRKEAELEAQRHRAELTHLGRVALMGEMSASLAHELNQPLAAIVSNAAAGQRFIDSGNVDLSELRELLADIRADGRRASEVVRGIRSMVKKGETVRQRTDLNEIVRDVVQLVQPDALLRSCAVKTSLAPTLPEIEGDPVQLRQVVLNLVLNAFDAMQDAPIGQRTVEVTTERNGDGTIRTTVRDYGSGISEGAGQRLFEPFFTTKSNGLGMGLAIVRSIVESHGGVIEAKNAEDGGACFHFTVSTEATAPI